MRQIEKIECDADFQRHLTDLGGVNYFGEPMFRIVWAQSLMTLMPTASGIYEEEPLDFDPCWLLQKWIPPEAFGTPALYEYMMRDEETGMPLGGPYPEFGQYETIVKFKSARLDTAKQQLEITTIPLDWEIIEHALPMMIQAALMNHEEIKAVRRAEKELAAKQVQNEMTDRLFDSLPEFYGPVSFAGQQNRTALIDREMAKIERQWRALGLDRKRLPRGFFQGKN